MKQQCPVAEVSVLGYQNRAITTTRYVGEEFLHDPTVKTRATIDIPLFGGNVFGTTRLLDPNSSDINFCVSSYFQHMVRSGALLVGQHLLFHPKVSNDSLLLEYITYNQYGEHPK